jgi:ADP-ribose pyrophosphatase
MMMKEKTISSRSIYDGRIITVRVDEVELPNGKTASREIVHHNGAVAVLAVTDEEKIVLVRQYRKPMDRILIEVPAGKLEGDEDPKSCAERELAEETGFKANSMELVASFYTSPGFSDELVHLYRGRGLTAGEAQPDEDEFVEVLYLTLAEAKKYIETGEIKDAKTIMAIYAWELDK